MAKRTFQVALWTPTVQAESAAMANTTYMAIEAGSSTMGLSVMEIYEGGQAAASAINIMVFARSGTIGTTPTALSSPANDGPLNSLTAALATVPITYIAASTGPFRLSTPAAGRLNLSFNSFGGIVRWVAAPGEEWGIIGQTIGTTASTLSSPSGSAGAMGSHIVYEVL